jgi:hypothetical protein
LLPQPLAQATPELMVETQPSQQEPFRFIAEAVAAAQAVLPQAQSL